MIERPPLTSQGRQRREAILRLMQETAHRRRIRRRIIQSTAACAAVVLMMTLALRWRSHGGGAMPTPNDYATTRSAPIEPIEPAASRPQIVIGRIETDPTILSRWSIVPQAQPTEPLSSIDDDDLIKTLADAGQPAGLIQIGGQTTLVTSSAAQ